ncbi:MAG: hypothetical protein U0531_00215 [Dehalococcoidia bacterium]
MVERYGWNQRRRTLINGLDRALRELRSFGCRTFYLDGSFVTAKDEPGDWDGCWEADGVDRHRLAAERPLLWDDHRGRRDQKRQYGGDIFPVKAMADPSERIILDQFQRDRHTRQPKGLLAIDLESLP